MPEKSAIFISIILIAFCAVFSAAAQQNPFLSSTSENDQLEPAETNNSSSASGQIKTPGFTLQNTELMQKIKTVQKKLQASISGFIADYKSGKNESGLWLILLLSFAYGFLHALGPGHRKVVLFSYFLTSPSKWKKGMAAGFLTAVLHAFSAIVIIGGLYFITAKALSRRFNDIAPMIEKASYILVLILGLFLLVTSLAEYIKKRHKAETDNRNIIFLIIISGLVPCPGAAAIMIFSFGFGVPLLGILSASAMSAGMGALLAIIPPAAVILRNRVSAIGKGDFGLNPELAHLLLTSAGAFILILSGLFFLI